MTEAPRPNGVLRETACAAAQRNAPMRNAIRGRLDLILLQTNFFGTKPGEFHQVVTSLLCREHNRKKT
jgi:hypothetical protein